MIETLQYWHKLEHFYPYVIGEQTGPHIKTFAIDADDRFALLDAPLPDGKALRYYAVYLGIFHVDRALEALEQGIGQKMRLRDDIADVSCFCTFTLTANREFKADSFKISSFPWAIHRVRDGKITIDAWDEDFHAFETEAFFRLYNHDGAFDYDSLCELRDWFAERMNWDIAYSDRWLRIDRVTKDATEKEILPDDSEEDDEAAEVAESVQSEDFQAEDTDTDEQVKQNDLLNSFYIRDLERIIDRVKGDAHAGGESFRRYMAHRADRRIDIEKDTDALLSLLSPRLLPKGRWPGDYGLRLMQQVDVNAFLCGDPAYHQPLFSVNGPPGTGKTTLLKDIIAAIVVERAMQMSALGMPDDAFGRMICKIEAIGAKGSFTNYVREIKPELKQYGILVASNNNGAVENVTHTLPSLQEVSSDYVSETDHCFSEVSDLLFGEGKTWALNAAALGNKRNRQRFVDAFWPIGQGHTGYDFNSALRESVRNASKTEWEAAKESFRATLDETRREYRQAQKAYKQLKQLLSDRKESDALEADIRTSEDKIARIKTALSTGERAIELSERRQNLILEKLRDIEKSQPLLWLKKLFSPRAPLMQTYRSLQKELQTQIAALHEARDAHFAEGLALSEMQSALEEQRARARTLREKLSRAEESLDAFREQTKSPLRMDAYFENPVGEKASLSSPWGYESFNRVRAKLFVEAMALHKAFVQNSKCLRDHLDAFSKMLRGQIPAKQLPDAAPVLLQSFLLAVPVVSTTFASVGNFLRHIPEEEIAYLFIDEAGQAMPQSAVGAIWRARNVIAVGDPLQIEPVVTLHDSVMRALAEHYGQSDVIASKYTSVQSLADMANRLGGYRTVVETNDLWIGAPLIVHNRCQRRVFDISNRIAYNEKMLYATQDRAQARCRWIQVVGDSQNRHYVPNQTDAIRGLVADAFAAFALDRADTQKYPSLFVISPFRSVKSGMAAYFRKELAPLLTTRGVAAPPDMIRKWIKTCIGTIHTFQGKEADTVILCLGVDSNGKNPGAVDWACERPNILNVAVTRSKENLYIVGDKAIWGEKPFFKTALALCE